MNVLGAYFIVMDRETGGWLPNARTATAAEITKERPPRIFNQKHHADQAVKHWLRGLLTSTWVESSHIAMDTLPGEGEVVNEIVKGTERHDMTERMEIVPVSLVEGIILWGDAIDAPCNPEERRPKRTTIPSKELGVTLKISEEARDELDRIDEEQAAAVKAVKDMDWR